MCASGHRDKAGCPPCIDHLGSARFFLVRDPPHLSAGRAGRESRSRSCQSGLRVRQRRRPSMLPGMLRPAWPDPQWPSTWRALRSRPFSRAQPSGATALRRRLHPWPWRDRCGHYARHRIRKVATGSSQRLVSRSASFSLPIQVAVIQIQERPPSGAVAHIPASCRSDAGAMAQRVPSNSVGILSLCCTAARILIQ